MRRLLKRCSLVAGLALLVGLQVGCGGDDEGAGAGSGGDGEEVYRVGAVLALTGDYSGTDKDSRAGLEATIAEINANGGVNGRQLEFEIEDSQSEPSRAALAAQALVDKYKPHVMIPDIPCLMALATLPVPNREGIITFTGCDSGDPPASNPEAFPTNFSTFPPPPTLGQPLVQGAELATGKDKMTVGFLRSDDAAGEALVEPVKAAAEGRGHTWAGDEAFAVGEPDLTVQLSKLQDAGADVVILWGQVGDGGNAMKSVRDLNWDAHVFGGTATVSAALKDEIPEGYQDNFNALVTGNSVREGGPETLDPFIQDYLQEASSDVQTLSVVGAVHDGLTLWKWAVERTKSTEPEKLVAELETLGDLPESEWPEGLQLSDNPMYNAEQHGLLNANLDTAWGVIKPSENIMGTYEGQPLECDCARPGS